MPEGGVGHYVGAGQIARADHAECDAQVAGIVAYHENHGYRVGGAYNEHACQHGGRWLHYLGPNQASGDTWANLNLHAVCAVIGDGDSPSDALKAAMRAAWDEAGGGQWITPHSHWFNTSCCGDPLRAWIAAGALPPSAPTLPLSQEDAVRLVKVRETQEWVLLTANGAERNVSPDRAWEYAGGGIPTGEMPAAYVDALVASVRALVPKSGGAAVPMQVSLTGTATP